MGNKRGRLCFIYQLDFDEHTLYYKCKVEQEEISEEVHSDNEFQQSLGFILEMYKTDRVEGGLKRFGLKDTKISGICIKSFPKSPLTSKLLELIYLCTGGQSGVDLVHLPFEGTVLDQPNIFIEAYSIFTQEYNKYMKEKTKLDFNKHL